MASSLIVVELLWIPDRRSAEPKIDKGAENSLRLRNRVEYPIVPLLLTRSMTVTSLLSWLLM
ncbi:MAG: hypothetical protein USCGTAYLOR_01251 [Chromatiales bacterium USCg_Taylor]|nr:MAG: hypothetical protein USCGTAYLOR_01251 [Chromatiales bacterium USCg_Taylor]